MKPCALLDVNALLALAWSHHADHGRMVAWHREWLPKSWAVCPLSQAGFLRISLNPAFVPTRTPCDVILETLRRYASLPGYRFFAALPGLADPKFGDLWGKVTGHQQVTDALFLALAMAEDVRLATFDRGIATLADRPDRVIEIP